MQWTANLLVGLLFSCFFTEASLFAQTVWITVGEETFTEPFDPCFFNPIVGGFSCETSQWTVYGDPTWGIAELSGDRRLWCLGSTEKDPQTESYTPNMDAWAIFGPLDFSNAVDAEISFDYYFEKEPFAGGQEGDRFSYQLLVPLVGEDGSTFDQGSSSGWGSVTRTLSDWPPNLNALGQKTVWLIFKFESDGINEDGPGAFIDNLRVRKLVPLSKNTLYFPHFGNGQGGGVWLGSEIELINPSSQGINYTVEIKDENGVLMPIALNGTPGTGQYQGIVPGNGTEVLKTSGTGDLKVGSVVVRADEEVYGYLLFKGSIGEAAVNASLRGRRFIVPVEASPGVRVGFALMGLEEASTVTLRLTTSQGEHTASAALGMSSQGQRAIFLDELTWDQPVDLALFSGSLSITGAEEVAVILLRLGISEISTLPVIKLE